MLKEIWSKFNARRQAALSRQAVQEEVNQDRITNGQLRVLSSDPVQDQRYLQYLEAMKSGDEEALAKIRSSMNKAQLADLILRVSSLTDQILQTYAK